jgi:hypothetical protein
MGKQILNGVIYGTGEIIKFSPEIYSFEEREVGVWTDLKPLYQKVYKFSEVMIYNNTWTEIPFMDELRGVAENVIYAMGVNGAINRPIEVTCSTNNTHAMCLGLRSGVDYIDTIIIQYTKTTDTPGSGHYTTSGGEAHHYSTSEQIVGTWFGEPLYEKTLQFTLDSTKTGNWVSFNHGISNIDKIVNASSFAANDNGIYYNAIRFASYSSYSSYVQAGGSFSLVAASRVDVGFQIGSDIPNSYNKIYVTIQYTKTTD